MAGHRFEERIDLFQIRFLNVLGEDLTHRLFIGGNPRGKPDRRTQRVANDMSGSLLHCSLATKGAN